MCLVDRGPWIPLQYAHADPVQQASDHGSLVANATVEFGCLHGSTPGMTAFLTPAFKDHFAHPCQHVESRHYD